MMKMIGSTGFDLSGCHRFAIVFASCLGLLSCLSVDAAVMSREKVAEEAIGGLDFEMGFIRVEKAIAPSLRVRVKHFMWKRLEECKIRGDYLGFLNAADDIVNGRSDQTTKYSKLPDGNTIRAICSALGKVRFRCDFISDKKLTVLVQNPDWNKFVFRCSRNEIQLDKKTGKVLYQTGKDFSPFVPVGYLTEVRDGNGFAVFGQDLVYVGAKGSIDRYAQNDLIQQSECLCRKVVDQEISMSEFRSKMVEMDKLISEKVLTQLTPISRKELEKVNVQVRAAEAAALVRSKDEFGNNVLGLSFCVGDHIVVQEGLVPYIHTAIVDESLLKLRRFQQARAWEKMAELLVPDEDVGGPNYYTKAWEALSKRRFSVRILFTIGICFIGRGTGWVSNSGYDGTGDLDVTIKIIEQDPVYVYASENNNDPLQNLISRSGFDAKQWLQTHKFVKTDASVAGKVPLTIMRKGFRDRSLLLENKPQNAPYATPLPPNYKFSLDEIQCNAAMYSFYRLRKVIDEIKSPSCPVITNVVEKKDSRGKTVKEIERRAQPNLPQEIKRLAKIFSNPVFVEVYRKYGGEEKPENLMSDWKRASKIVGSPEPLRDDIKRRWGEAYRDRLSRQELKERYEVYDRRAKGEDFKPDQFNKWALEDQSLIVYKRYIDLLNSLTGYLYEIQKQRYQKIRRKK